MIVYIVIDTDTDDVVDVFDNKEYALNLVDTDLFYYLIEKEVKMQSQKFQDCKKILDNNFKKMTKKEAIKINIETSKDVDSEEYGRDLINLIYG